MNTTDTLSRAEDIISTLSGADKARLLKWLKSEVDDHTYGIEKKEGVMGGAACVENTRIPVWLLVQSRQLGLTDADLLRNYPSLKADDLTNSWKYASAHKVEIEQSILANEADDE